MNGTCKLCRKPAELELSHLIPKFIGKWKKKTSITGFLRNNHEISVRQQDIAKEYWLCGNCEDIFSVWETKFANIVFYPVVNKNASIINYNNWMSKFCASLSWRTLTYIRSKNIEQGTYNDDPSYTKEIEAAENHLSKYLLGKLDNLNQYEQHLYPLSNIESTTSMQFPTNLNRYFLRATSMDIIGNDHDIFTYTKLPSFIILGCIKVQELKKLRNSRIAINQGQISPRVYSFPKGFTSYIFDKAKYINTLHDSIPKDQLKKLNEYIDNNPEKAVNSELFKAFLFDYKQFGDKVFE